MGEVGVSSVSPAAVLVAPGSTGTVTNVGTAPNLLGGRDLGGRGRLEGSLDLFSCSLLTMRERVTIYAHKSKHRVATPPDHAAMVTRT